MPDEPGRQTGDIIALAIVGTFLGMFWALILGGGYLAFSGAVQPDIQLQVDLGPVVFWLFIVLALAFGLTLVWAYGSNPLNALTRSIQRSMQQAVEQGLVEQARQQEQQDQEEGE